MEKYDIMRTFSPKVSESASSVTPLGVNIVNGATNRHMSIFL